MQITELVTVQPTEETGNVFRATTTSFLFEGDQFSMPARPLPGQDVLWPLVGYFSMFGEGVQGGPVPNARRHRFGWRATLNQMI